MFTAEMDSMIVDLYTNKKLGVREIAKETGIGRTPIMRRLRELNVHMRTNSETKSEQNNLKRQKIKERKPC